MVYEFALGCLTVLLLTLIISRAWTVRGGGRNQRKSVPLSPAPPDFAKIEDLAKLKIGLETRMKAVETQWDDMYTKLRRKEARAYRDTQKQNLHEAEEVQEPKAITAVDLERQWNRRAMGLG